MRRAWCGHCRRTAREPPDLLFGLRGMSIVTNNRDQVAKRQRKLDREARAALIRKNAEDLVMALCGKGFERAYNPNCPPKGRGRPNR